MTTDREVVIWSEDFANGIDNAWTNTEAGGIAQWEYRGPLTIPNNEIGSRGLCTEQAAPGNVIESPTASNGFVIFDSNWWDNPDQPCTLANFGTGPAPGPHLAILTSPAIDLSAHPDIALRFNQYLRNYNAMMRVEASADGVSWTTVFDNSSTPLDSENNMSVLVPISAIVGGQPNAKIRFVFDGNYYFWQLDDVCVVEILPNDLASRLTTFGDFDFNDPSHPTGFELMPYTKYPDEMAPLLKFSTQCDNIGSNPQSNCRLNVEVKNLQSSTIIHTAQSDEGFTLQPGATLELRASDYQMPATQANYHIHYAISENETDQNPQNNMDTLGFQITDCTYARDFNFTNAYFLPGPDLSLLDFEVGNVFLVEAANQSCYSISVAIAAGTSLPTSIYARLYAFDAQESIAATLVGTTSSLNITAEMFNSFGQGNFVHLLFDSPIPVNNNETYLAVIGSPDGAENVFVAFSGGSAENTSWVRFLPDQWYYLNATPMVRMNFGTNISVDENAIKEDAFSVFPNPASSHLNLDLKPFLNQSVTIRITDQTGNIVFEQNINKVSVDNENLSVQALAQGIYFIQLKNENSMMMSKFMKM